MKKFIFITLVLILIISLTACTTYKNDKETNSVVSTEDTSSEVKSEPSEPTDADTSEITSEENKAETSETNKPSTSKPSVTSPDGSSTNKNNSTASKPNTNTNSNTNTQPTHESTTSVPSIEFLESVGLTYEESQAIVEAAKTCKYCGKSIELCHRYGIDIKCYDCGEMAQANTCHFCK